MGRKVAIPWHALFSIAAGFLYFFFVLPRWPEMMGDTAHTLGTSLRIVTGALVALAALPVVFTLLRTRKPELGTPQLALSLRIWSIVAHVLAGVLIIGTAISEIWLSLDAAGRWLFGIYGAAAAIALLGIFAFYLSFVAELPPPPPKPIKAKKPKQRRVRRKKGDEADADPEHTDHDRGARVGKSLRRPVDKLRKVEKKHRLHLGGRGRRQGWSHAPEAAGQKQRRRGEPPSPVCWVHSSHETFPYTLRRIALLCNGAPNST